MRKFLAYLAARAAAHRAARFRFLRAAFVAARAHQYNLA